MHNYVLSVCSINIMLHSHIIVSESLHLDGAQISACLLLAFDHLYFRSIILGNGCDLALAFIRPIYF